MLALTITLLIVGSFALLSFGLAARRALRRNPCPSCARSSLRWSGSRLVRSQGGSTVDVVDRGHCHACAATIFQSHQNGWWRATTTDDFPPSLAFTIPLAWRDSLRHWRILDRSLPVTRLSGSPRSTSLAVGVGLIAGFACLTIAGVLITPKVKTSTARLDDIPPVVFKSSATSRDSITPVDTSGWDQTSDWDQKELLDGADPADDIDPSSHVVASIGVRVKMSGAWTEITNRKTPFGTMVGFQRHHVGAPTVVTIAAVPPMGGMDDRMLATLVRSAVSEAQMAAGEGAREITCYPTSRGQHCASSLLGYRFFGWSWKDNGRVFLVLAILPLAEANLSGRMKEVFDVVDSIEPVI